MFWLLIYILNAGVALFINFNFWVKKCFETSYAFWFCFCADYLVTKCGVLMMSLFVFFTTTMSVSFTLRETQTRMLKFTGLLYFIFNLGHVPWCKQHKMYASVKYYF